MDNVVVVKELIFSLQKRGIVGNIVKVDITKAFDTIDWEFLMEILAARGFGTSWRGWIHHLLGTSKASIIVNDSQSGHVRYRRGLRQGDPLSPLLFVLVINVLGTIFTHALSSQVLYGVPIG